MNKNLLSFIPFYINIIGLKKRLTIKGMTHRIKTGENISGFEYYKIHKEEVNYFSLYELLEVRRMEAGSSSMDCGDKSIYFRKNITMTVKLYSSQIGVCRCNG